jgi:hypothetical protein
LCDGGRGDRARGKTNTAGLQKFTTLLCFLLMFYVALSTRTILIVAFNR